MACINPLNNFGWWEVSFLKSLFYHNPLTEALKKLGKVSKMSVTEFFRKIFGNVKKFWLTFWESLVRGPQTIMFYTAADNIIT